MTKSTSGPKVKRNSLPLARKRRQTPRRQIHSQSGSLENSPLRIVVLRGVRGRPSGFPDRHDNDNCPGGPTYASGQ